MNILATLQSIGMTAVGFLFVLTLIIFVHEFGHFIVGRWCGVGVTTFSMGFGPELIGFTDRKGTRWRISAIPLGGYVKFVGDATEAGGPDTTALATMSAEQRAGALSLKPVWQRAAVVAAGPIANFILAIGIFAMIYSVFGTQETKPLIDAVRAGSAAEAAGLQAGDLVVAVDGKPIVTFGELQRAVSASDGATLAVTVHRADTELTLRVTPIMEEETRFGSTVRVPRLGISRTTATGDVVTEHLPLPQALVRGVQESWFIITRTVSSIAGIFAGRESADQLGGPIRVAEVAGQVASMGIVPLLNLAALLSVSIGLLNLLPVPILDGGHLMFYAIEAIRGRPLSERAQEIGFGIGAVLVALLMIFATSNDVRHIFGI